MEFDVFGDLIATLAYPPSALAVPSPPPNINIPTELLRTVPISGISNGWLLEPFECDYGQSCIFMIHGIHRQAIIRPGNDALTYRQKWKPKSRLIYLLVEDDEAAESMC